MPNGNSVMREAPQCVSLTKTHRYCHRPARMEGTPSPLKYRGEARLEIGPPLRAKLDKLLGVNASLNGTKNASAGL